MQSFGITQKGRNSGIQNIITHIYLHKI